MLFEASGDVLQAGYSFYRDVLTFSLLRFGQLSLVIHREWDNSYKARNGEIDHYILLEDLLDVRELWQIHVKSSKYFPAAN